MIKQKLYFIETLSHDLRVSTIAQIRGLELLEKECRQDKNKIELVNYISDSCKFTLDMISTLLSTYRYENGEQVLRKEICNINELVENSRCSLVKTCEDKNLKILPSFENDIYVTADKTSLSKLISTLISTAICYSECNTCITVNAQKSSNIFKMTIGYKGKPLSDEECRRMFSDNPRYSTVGHGIRMHLCKKIIDFHKGKIFVKNCKNKINLFTFTIPLKESHCEQQTGFISSFCKQF